MSQTPVVCLHFGTIIESEHSKTYKMTHTSSEDSGSACIVAQSDKSQMSPEETLGSCLPIDSPAKTDLTARMCIFLSENMSSC